MHWAAETSTRARPLAHPLMGTRFGTLLECFCKHGWPDAGYWQRLLKLLATCAVRTPFHEFERRLVRKRIARQELLAPPVFIIGHPRSGTTYLHELISRDPRFGCVTLMQAAFPLSFVTSMLRPLLVALLPTHRPMDSIPVTIGSPTEEEMAMASFGPLSSYHMFFFPKHARRIYRESVHFDGVSPERLARWWTDYDYFLRKVQGTQPTRRMLLKNPANTARVAALRRRYPGAKFIHIHRHPERVYVSALFLHRKLQEAWALQDWRVEELPEMVLQNYVDLMNAADEQTRDMPRDELAEVAFESLDSDPLGTLERIYQQLGLPGFDAAAVHFRDHVEKSRGFKKNELSLSPREQANVRRALASTYQKYGYTDAYR